MSDSLVQELRLIVRDEASRSLGSIGAGIEGLLGQLRSLAGAWAGFEGMKQAVATGVQFAASMEDAQIGIAGVVGSMVTYRDATGNVVQGNRAFSRSMEISADIMADLKVRALETKATLSEMVQAFQVGVQPLGMAGIKLTEVAEATQRLTQVAGAAGIPLAQLGVELRQFARGDEVRGRLVQVLGYNKETIQELSKSGKLMEDLRKRTDAFAQAASASALTLTGRWSNFKDALEQTLGAAAGGLYEKLKTALADVSGLFVTFGKNAQGALTATLNPELIARLTEIFDRLGLVVDRVKEVAPAFMDLATSAMESVSLVAGALSQLPFAATLKLLADLNEATNGWLGALYLASKAVAGLGLLFGVQGGAIATGLALWGTLTSAWETALIAVYVGVTDVAAGITAMGATAGVALAASIGLWVALAAAIGGAIYAGKLFFDLMDEWKAEEAADKGTESAMELQLKRMRETFDEFKGPLTQHQALLRRQMDAIGAAAKADMEAFGYVSQQTMDRYIALQRAVKNSGINRTPDGLTMTPNGTNAGREAAEEMAKAAEAYAKFVAKITEANAQSKVQGLALAFRKLDDEARRSVEELKKHAKEAGIAAAEQQKVIDTINDTTRTKKFLEAAKQTGRTYITVVRSTVEQSLELFKGGEAAVEAYFGVLTLKREEWNREAQRLLEVSPDDPNAGTKAGMYGILASIPSAAESAATAVTSAWSVMARGFDDLFFNVLSGRLRDLKDMFKSLWEQLLGVFTRYLSEMFQRWLSTQLKMGQVGVGTGTANGVAGVAGAGGAQSFNLGNSTGWGSMGAGYANGGGWSGAATGAMAGYGVGSVVGQFGGGKYNQTGGQIGGMVGGMVFGVVGAVVGAILGTLIGALLSPNTEKKIKVEMDRLAQGGELAAAGAAISKTRDAIIGGIADLYVKASLGQTAGAFDAKKALAEYMKGRSFEVHAGSNEDLEADYKKLFEEIIPREMLHTLMGHGAQGAQEYPGIRGGTKFYSGNIDNKDAPIPKLLDQLGFAADRIVWIGQQIDTRAPEEFIEWLNKLVNVAVTTKKLKAEMGKTFAEIDAEMSAKESAGAKGAFAERAAAIADVFKSLSAFSGDDQLARMEQAQQDAAAFWNDVLDYVAQLRDAMNQLSAGIQAQRQKYHDFLNPMGATETGRVAWETVQGGWGKLAGATSPEEVVRVTNEMRDAIDAIFNVMAERYTRGTALLRTLGDQGTAFGSMGSDVAREDSDTRNPIYAMQRGALEAARKVSEAAQLSGIEQIEAIEGVAAAAADMYEQQRAMLASITANIADLEKSIEAQKWELSLDGLDSKGTAGAIADRIKSLQEQILTATTPEQVRALTSEIQSLMSRYLGTFAADDPERAHAKDWISKMLDRTLGLAKEKYAEMAEAIEAVNRQMKDTLEAAGKLIGDNVTDAANWINQLTHTLNELDRVMREKMGALADGILATGEVIRQELEKATLLFTGAVTGAAGAIGGGPGGGGGREPENQDNFTAAVTRSTSAVSEFEAALVNVTSLLKATSGGGETPASVQTVAPSGRQVAAAVKRYRMATTTRVA